MKVGKLSIIVILAMFSSAIYAQDDVNVEPNDSDGDVVVEEGDGANQSEQDRVSRLAEASGKTEEEIYALRNGTVLDPAESAEPTDEPAESSGKKLGWGQIAHMLGLHPGVLGHGTGDKFMPDLPEVDGDALDAVQTARERALERKAERKEVRAEAKKNRNDLKAARRRDKANNGKRPDKSGKPDKSEKPDKNGK